MKKLPWVTIAEEDVKASASSKTDKVECQICGMKDGHLMEVKILVCRSKKCENCPVKYKVQQCMVSDADGNVVGIKKCSRLNEHVYEGVDLSPQKPKVMTDTLQEKIKEILEVTPMIGPKALLIKLTNLGHVPNDLDEKARDSITRFLTKKKERLKPNVENFEHYFRHYWLDESTISDG
jgi:hypothetical protein